MAHRRCAGAGAAAALALLALQLAVSGSARAAGDAAEAADAPVGGQRVAVLRLAFGGGVPEASRDQFAQRLVEGLAAAQFEVVPEASVRRRLGTAGIDVAGCRNDDCYGRAAQALGVAYVVAGSVDEHDRIYEITLELVGRSGAAIGTNRERCEICGIEEATEKMGLAASALRARLEALARTPARVIIRSRPVGARVKVDGESAGRTPVDRELPGGVHKLVLRADGYDELERTVTAVNGVDETLNLELVPLPSRFPMRMAGWVAVVVGVAAMAAGVWAVAIDGNEVACAASEQDASHHCPNVRNTRALGAALVGVGAASGTIGGVWLYFGSMGTPHPTEGTPQASAGLTLSGRF